MSPGDRDDPSSERRPPAPPPDRLVPAAWAWGRGRFRPDAVAAGIGTEKNRPTWHNQGDEAANHSSTGPGRSPSPSPSIVDASGIITPGFQRAKRVMRTSRWVFALILTAVALGTVAWLVTSVNELHDRLARHSEPMALAFIGSAALVALASALTAIRMFWRLSHSPRAPDRVKAPEDIVQAAAVQADKAELVINQVKDPSAKAELGDELASIRADGVRRRFHLVVFGTGSAGKTSLINALLGQHVGRTEPVMGTTRHGEEHTQVVEGVEGTVLVTDTPGISEIGEGGAMREGEARDLAARADLLLFVVDHDLIRSEYEPLSALARQGKRSIVVFNKQDRFTDPDRAAVLDKLRERLAGIVPSQDVVAVAADPPPIPLRNPRPPRTPQDVDRPPPPPH